MTADIEIEDQAIECANCGHEMKEDDDSIYYLKGEGNLCGECYHDLAETCLLCGKDDLCRADLSRFIVVNAELADTGTILPGIYRISSYPFLSIPMIGSGSIHGNDVLFIDCLPKPSDDYEISGHICRKCALPYSQIYGEIYGKINEGRGGRYRRKRGYWPMFSAQRIRMKAAFDANPERLLDLEEDHAHSLEDLREKFGVPTLEQKTWREYPVIQHKGVTIYAVYPSEQYVTGWVTTRPEPCYRNAYKPETFDASSLPTFDMDAAMDCDRDSRASRGLYRDAIIKAIDQGILTQDGFKR